MSVRKRGKTWSARWRSSDGRQQEKGGFISKQSAETYAMQRKLDTKNGKRSSQSDLSMTLSYFANKVWLPTLNVRNQTLLDYERAMNSHLLPKFGSAPMSGIKLHQLQTWANEMRAKGLQERTIEKHLNLMSSVMKMALQNDYIQKNPFSGWKRGKARRQHEPRILSLTEVEALANAMPPQYRLAVWLGYYTGMRPSEILGLTRDRLDLANKTIRIDRQISRNTSEIFEVNGLKTRSSFRTIGILNDLEPKIMEHLMRFGEGPHGLIFKNRVGGILRYKDVARLFRLANKKSKMGLLDGQGLHQLRHGFVSISINKGADSKSLQDWMGHATADETMNTYGHRLSNSAAQLKAIWDRDSTSVSNVNDISIAN